jgi:hypothetical protein
LIVSAANDLGDCGVPAVLQHFAPAERPGNSLDHALSIRLQGAAQVSVVPSGASPSFRPPRLRIEIGTPAGT